MGANFESIWYMPLVKIETKQGILDIEVRYHENQDGRTFFESSFKAYDAEENELYRSLFPTMTMMRSVAKEDVSIIRIARTISTFIPSTSLDNITAMEFCEKFLDQFYWPISNFASMIHKEWKQRDIDDVDEPTVQMLLATSLALDFLYEDGDERFFENPIVFPTVEQPDSHPALSVEWGKPKKRVGFVMGQQEEYYKCLKAVTDLLSHDAKKLTD